MCGDLIDSFLRSVGTNLCDKNIKGIIIAQKQPLGT